MAPRAAFAILLLLAAGTCVQAQQVACPLSAATASKLDFKPAAAVCKAGPELCKVCTCALLDAFAPVIAASNVTLDASTVTPAAAQQLVTACLPTVLPVMTRAGLSLGVLVQLQNCSPADIPCLAQAVATGN